MFLLQSNELLDHTTNIIHEKTQQHAFSVDLTVAEIYTFSGAGSLDFGGSEFQPAPAEPVDPEKKKEEDDYGWWTLGSGIYKAIFNEQLKNREDTLAVIAPHQHASEAGILAETVLIPPERKAEPVSYIFRVPAVGCHIKENARIATLHILAD
ncbi:dCTP deaminase [Halalkalibaculum sp. DA3122]|uniref:dCTP deaminase n=1 Tax=unclassified Halalkalibaculum TaxID=2964617 RepID=UPI003754CAB6